MIERSTDRDELLALTSRAMINGMRKRDYPGGAIGMLSDLLFSCGYVMTPKRIRSISSQYWLALDGPQVENREKSLSRKTLR